MDKGLDSIKAVEEQYGLCSNHWPLKFLSLPLLGFMTGLEKNLKLHELYQDIMIFVLKSWLGVDLIAG